MSSTVFEDTAIRLERTLSFKHLGAWGLQMFLVESEHLDAYQYLCSTNNPGRGTNLLGTFFVAGLD